MNSQLSGFPGVYKPIRWDCWLEPGFNANDWQSGDTVRIKLCIEHELSVPTHPETVVASKINGGDVRVTWIHRNYYDLDPGGIWHPDMDVESYVIERSRNGGPWTIVAEPTVGGDSVEEPFVSIFYGSYIDKNASTGRDRYRIRAVSSVDPSHWTESNGM